MLPATEKGIKQARWKTLKWRNSEWVGSRTGSQMTNE